MPRIVVPDYRVYRKRLFPDWQTPLTAAGAPLSVRPLTWDTAIFGKATGSVDIGPGLADVPDPDALIARTVQESSCELLFLRTDLQNQWLIPHFEAAGFSLVDVLNIYGIPTGSFNPGPGDWTACSRIEPHGGWLTTLAAGAFADGRFFQDPAIPPATARHAYRSLLAAIVQKPGAAILLAMDRSTPAGFVIGVPEEDCPQVCCLWLIAVDPAFRGLGVGSFLVTALAQAVRETHSFLEIGTQTGNIPANRLYQRLGCRQVAGLVTLHYHRSTR